jgi:hypothetical protein
VALADAGRSQKQQVPVLTDELRGRQLIDQ